MASDPSAPRIRPNAQATRHLTITSGTSSMFSSAQNISITGGAFTITPQRPSSSLEELYNRVAPNAIFNAEGHAGMPYVHPGTREEVLYRAERWRDAQAGEMPPIFGIIGPAGAGKTAIVKTIAERCKAQGVPQASYFFSQPDDSRNSLHQLVPTLIVQIISLYPAVGDSVASVLSSQSYLLGSNLMNQLAMLIAEPLRAIRQSTPSYIPLVLMIDGLDKCESKEGQRDIIYAFAQVAGDFPGLFRLLLASRGEPHIRMVFNHISRDIFPFYLDSEHHDESRDIQLFVDAEFDRVRNTHPLRHTLSPTWPSSKDVNRIIKNSSGQFVYATTVMRTIASPTESPALSLKKVLAAPRAPSAQAPIQTNIAPPSDDSTGTASRLNNATNSNIMDDNGSSPLEALYSRVARNALFNAGAHADEDRPHPATQQEILAPVEKWRDAKDTQTPPIFWLSGPAGAGKTTIVQTIVEQCVVQGVPQAYFAFSRTDASRNSLAPLVATLIQQIISLHPDVQDSVATVLSSSDPPILDASLEEQLTQLISIPLQAIQKSTSSYIPPLLMIDGLDECESEEGQRQIVQAFHKVLTTHPHVFRLLVASRDESRIQKAFKTITSDVLSLSLADGNHIRAFLDHKFDEVRKTHKLDATWPSAEDVDKIVKNSLGQYVYADTVMRFIEVSSVSPGPALQVSLERALAAPRISRKSALPHLDALYAYILSQVDNQEALKDILYAQLLMMKLRALKPEVLPPRTRLETLLEPHYTPELILSCLANLTPVLRYESDDHGLRFVHPSFPDFLQDKSRSGNYFADTEIIMSSPEILPAVLDKGLNGKPWIQLIRLILTHMLEFPPGVMDALASSKKFWADLGPSADTTIFVTIYDLCSGDDIEHFQHIIRHWIDSCKLVDVEYDNIRRVPFSNRYFQMARASRDYALDDEMTAALCPVTDFDRRESASWLKDLLQRMHKEIYRHDRDRYTQLSEKWISWAILNDVPCDGLPGAKQYIRSGKNVEPPSHSSLPAQEPPSLPVDGPPSHSNPPAKEKPVKRGIFQRR